MELLCWLQAERDKANLKTLFNDSIYDQSVMSAPTYTPINRNGMFCSERIRNAESHRVRLIAQSKSLKMNCFGQLGILWSEVALVIVS